MNENSVNEQQSGRAATSASQQPSAANDTLLSAGAAAAHNSDISPPPPPATATSTTNRKYITQPAAHAAATTKTSVAQQLQKKKMRRSPSRGQSLDECHEMSVASSSARAQPQSRLPGGGRPEASTRSGANLLLPSSATTSSVLPQRSYSVAVHEFGDAQNIRREPSVRRQSDFSASELDRAISAIARDSRLSLDKYTSSGNVNHPPGTPEEVYDPRYAVFTAQPAPANLAAGGQKRSRAKISLPILGPMAIGAAGASTSAVASPPLSDGSSSVFPADGSAASPKDLLPPPGSPSAPRRSVPLLKRIPESDDAFADLSTSSNTPQDDDTVPEIVVTTDQREQRRPSLVDDIYSLGTLPDELTAAHSTDDVLEYLLRCEMTADGSGQGDNESGNASDDERTLTPTHHRRNAAGTAADALQHMHHNNNDQAAHDRNRLLLPHPRTPRRYSDDPACLVPVRFLVGDMSPAVRRSKVDSSTNSDAESDGSDAAPVAVVLDPAKQRSINRIDTQSRVDKQTRWSLAQQQRFAALSEQKKKQQHYSRRGRRPPDDAADGVPRNLRFSDEVVGGDDDDDDTNNNTDRDSGTPTPPAYRKQATADRLEHKAHQVLVELHELIACDSGIEEWRQTGRWVKYEETLEVGADKFGRPHVPTLSFHSLLEIRRLIEMGTIVMDVENVVDYGSLVDELMEVLRLNQAVLNTDAEQLHVLQSLLLPHRHINDPVGQGIVRQHSCHSLQTLSNRAVVCPIGSTSDEGHYATVKSPNAHSTSNGSNGLATSMRSAEDATLLSVDTHVSWQAPRFGLPRLFGRARRAVSTETGPGATDADANNNGHPHRRSRTQSSFRRSVSATAKQVRRFHHNHHLHHHHHLHIDHELMKRLNTDCESALTLVGKADYLTTPVILFVRLLHAVDMPGLIEVPKPVRFVFVLLGPREAVSDYHEIGRSVSTLIANQNFQRTAYAADGHADILRAINEFLDDSIVLPPGDVEHRSLVDFSQIKSRSKNIRERRKALARRPSDLDQFIHEQRQREEQDPLRRQGKLFGGARREFCHRLKYLRSDYTDAAAWQCVMAIAFIFFTCFFPAVTFGAILGEATGSIGVKETLFATGLCGTIYALCSAQPLVLLGVCGPILAYEASLYQFVGLMGVDLLTARLWIAVCAALLCLVVVALEASFLIRYMTRFADDIMSGLVSAVFFVECFQFIIEVFEHNHILSLKDYYTTEYSCSTASCNCSHDGLPLPRPVWHNASQSVMASSAVHEHDTEAVDFDLYRPYQKCHQPNTALLTASLVLGTFIVAFCMRRLRNSTYFGRTVRQALGDFSLTLAIVCMIAFDVLIIRDDNLTVKLRITTDFEPTKPYRPWLVSPFPIPAWFIPLTAVAGVLLFMLVFIETECCQSVFAKKDNMLYKGTGYHWDLLLSCLLLVVCAAFGWRLGMTIAACLPFLCAAPVRSQAHLNSLTSYDLRAPGQKPKVSGVIEQRVTALVLHLLIGLCVCVPYILQQLSQIPVAILFGVFLYLGVMNTYGNDMLSRAVLLFVPVKYHPNVSYCNRVRTWRMHLYSGVQLVCFVFVLSIKYIHATAIAFPVAVLIAILVRHQLLPLFFTQFELNQLDGQHEDEEEQRDIYEESRGNRMKTRVGP